MAAGQNEWLYDTIASESPASCLRLSSACSASAQIGQKSSVKNSASTVRFVGAGNTGASEHRIKKKAMNGKKMISFFMGHYTDNCGFVKKWPTKKGGLRAPFFMIFGPIGP
jgi:hypothetical protein